MKLARRLLIGVAVALAGFYLLAVVLYAIPVVSGALDKTMEVKFSRPDPSIIADFGNGLTAEQKQTFYHLSQGSEILPWIVLTAVDVADPGSAKPFVDNLERYGLLPDPGRDGLPVGLTVSSNPFTFGMDFVGVNCAACHVSELRHGNKAVRVDGAPNMFNLQLFYSEAIDAVMATTSDRGNLWHALKRLGRQDYQRYGIAAPLVRPATLAYSGVLVLLHRDRLDARLELISVIRAAKEQRDPQHPTSGFGRLDAFDGTRNFIFTRLRKADAAGEFAVNRANMVKLDAPVKFPWLWSRKASPPPPIEVVRQHPERFPQVWGFRDFDWIEWTINTNTVMERNFTETLGAGSTVVLDPKSGSLFESSIPIRNLHELELAAYYLDPPRWPAAVFRDIKPDLAAAGERIFQSQCAGCHAYGQDRRTSTGLLRLRGMTPDHVGTDSVVALRISCPVPDTGALSIQPRSYSAEEATILKDCAGVKAGTAFSGNSFARTVQTGVDRIKQKAFAAAGVDAALQKSMEDVDRRGPDRCVTRCSTFSLRRGPMLHGPCTASGPRHPICTTDLCRRCTICCCPRRNVPRRLHSAIVSMTRSRSASSSMPPAVSRTAWSTPRGPGRETVGISGARILPNQIARRFWNISRRTDAKRDPTQGARGHDDIARDAGRRHRPSAIWWTA